MSKRSTQPNEPPKLARDHDGEVTTASLADLLEWFLMYDERTARIRHQHTEELFQWKQQDDKVNGIAIYPFENAEARFAVGSFQALAENNTEDALHNWISSLLEAIQDSHKTKTDITESYGLDADLDSSAVDRSQKLTTNVEKRILPNKLLDRSPLYRRGPIFGLGVSGNVRKALRVTYDRLPSLSFKFRISQPV